MHTTVSARHATLDDPIRDRAVQVLERLARFTPRAKEGTAVFDHVGAGAHVELRLHCTRGRVLVARGDGTDPRSALDRAEDRMSRQLDRVGSRARASRHPLNS